MVSFMAQETGLVGKTGRYQPLLGNLLISHHAAAVGPNKPLIRLKNKGHRFNESTIITLTSAPVSKNGRKRSKEEGRETSSAEICLNFGNIVQLWVTGRSWVRFQVRRVLNVHVLGP